jgi:hypothetical protein
MQAPTGDIDLAQKTLHPLDSPFFPRLSPISWVRPVTHISRSYTSNFTVPGEGFEPPTFGLQILG